MMDERLSVSTRYSTDARFAGDKIAPSPIGSRSSCTREQEWRVWEHGASATGGRLPASFALRTDST